MDTDNFCLVSYNIHKGMSPLNAKVTLAGMAQALGKLAPDVLCLQEVQGQNLKRVMAFDEYPDQAQHDWFGEYLALSADYGKNAQYGHGHHGNAVLSRFVLDPKHNVNITVNRLEQRGVLHCEIYPHGKKVVVLNAHLNLLHKDRKKQYQAIIDYIKDTIDDGTPLVLAGDFNDWSKQSQKLLASLGMTEVFAALDKPLPPTFPARFALLCLDRIYVKNLVVKDACVHTGAPWSSLSDHLPMQTVLGF